MHFAWISRGLFSVFTFSLTKTQVFDMICLENSRGLLIFAPVCHTTYYTAIPTQFHGHIPNDVSSKTGRAHSKLQCCHDSAQLLCVAAGPKRPGWQPSFSPWHSTSHHQVHIPLPSSLWKQSQVAFQKEVLFNFVCIVCFFFFAGKTSAVRKINVTR